jgi:hypothetical protein
MGGSCKPLFIDSEDIAVQLEDRHSQKLAQEVVTLAQ